MKRPILFWLLLMASAMGQEHPSPAPPDFTPAFKHLVALGMPPLDDKAKWAKIPDQMSGGFSDYRLREVLGNLKGNGWLLNGPDGKPRILPATQTEITPLDDANGRRGPAKPPTEADLEKDFQKILKALEKKKAENSRFSGLYEVDLGGSLLLLATQFHQTGKPQLANQLTAAVFDTWPVRESVIDAAVTNLADREFEKLTDRFFNSGDWATYHADLTAIQKKFPRGWPTGQALNLLLPQLAKQVAGEKPAPPALPGVELDKRALDAIARLTEKPKPDSQDVSDEAILKRHGIKISEIPASQRSEILRSLRRMQMDGDGERLSASSYWILEEKDEDGESGQDDSPLAPLLALKLDALPALAAMLGDPYLTPYPKPNDRGYYSSFSSSESEAEKLEKAYQSMNRPASRGDIARMLLENAVPKQENNNGEPDADELRERVLDFWKLHRKSTPGDLAAAFLQEGDSSQQHMAARQLTSSSDPKHHKIFEDHILGSENPVSEYDLVKTYLGTRKAAAKPFCESYAKLVREQVKSMDKDQLPWEARESGGVEKMLKNLESFVGGKSYRSMAKDIAKGDEKDADAAIRALCEVMQSEPYTKQLYALLEGAVAAENPQIRSEFLIWVHRIDSGEAFDEEESGPDAKTKAPVLRKLPDAEIKVWRKLVADQRMAEVTDHYREESRKEKLSVMAAGALCGSASPSLTREIYQASLILNTPVGDLVMKHAEAILDGKPLPTLPDGSKVSKERLAAIVAETAAKKDLAIIEHLNSLTPDERAAWLQWWQKPEEPSLPDSVRDLQFIVTDVQKPSDPEKAPSPAANLIGTGFKLTPDSIPKLVGTLAPEADKLSRSMVVLGPRQGPGLGAQSRTFEIEPRMKQADGKATEDEAALQYKRHHIGQIRSAFSEVLEELEKKPSASAAICVSLTAYSDRNIRLRPVWLVENGKATLVPPDESQDKEESPSIDSAIRSLAENRDRQRFQVLITILNRADAGKIREAASKAGEDETLDGFSGEVLPFPE